MNAAFMSLPPPSSHDEECPTSSFGQVFGVCLATDARAQLQQHSVKRAGAWGALSALAFPLAFEVGGRLLMQRPLSWFQMYTRSTNKRPNSMR